MPRNARPDATAEQLAGYSAACDERSYGESDPVDYTQEEAEEAARAERLHAEESARVTKMLDVQEWSAWRFPCEDCGRRAFVSVEALQEMHTRHVSDAEGEMLHPRDLASDLQCCLSCYYGGEVVGEHTEAPSQGSAS